MEKRSVDSSPLNAEGILRLPAEPAGLVIFAHGAGSSRHSPRNNHVAESLGESALDRVVELAADWFTRHLGAAHDSSPTSSSRRTSS